MDEPDNFVLKNKILTFKNQNLVLKIQFLTKIDISLTIIKNIALVITIRIKSNLEIDEFDDIKQEKMKKMNTNLRTRKEAFFSRLCIIRSAVRSVRPVLLKLSTSKRVLISNALKSLKKKNPKKKTP